MYYFNYNYVMTHQMKNKSNNFNRCSVETEHLINCLKISIQNVY